MGEILVIAHHIQVEVGRNREQVQHLVQHASMLGGDADSRLNAGGISQGLDDRRHLDGFRPGSKNTQHTHSGL